MEEQGEGIWEEEGVGEEGEREGEEGEGVEWGGVV